VKRGGRGFSYPKNQRDRDKAEVFEAALPRSARRSGDTRPARRQS